MQKIIALALGFWLAVDHRIAGAQTAADKVAANTLFNKGKKLIGTGDIAGACALFEASLRMVIQFGTQFALAGCYEELGKTASAWAEFRAAASTAAKSHDDTRQRFAEDHAAALEVKLSKIVVKLEPGYRVDNLEIKRDGAVMSSAEIGVPVFVDPGEHTVEASAPGWVAWSNKVYVLSPGIVEVVVPALEKAPELMPGPAGPGTGHARRLLAYKFGGGGVTLVGISLGLRVVANSRWSVAQQHCQQGQCDPAGLDLAHGAQTMSLISTGTFLAGTAAVATGVILYLTAHPADIQKSSPALISLRIVPEVGTARLGFTLQGRF